MTMNTKIFEEEFAAVFEDDEQFANAYDDMLRQIHESENELPNDQLLEIWNKVAKSEAKIDAKLKHHPGHKALNKIIENEQKELALAENELKQAREQHIDVLKAIRDKRKILQRSIDGEDDEVVVSSVRRKELARFIRQYHKELALALNKARSTLKKAQLQGF